MVIWKFRFLSYFRNSVKGQEGGSTMGILAFLILKLSKCIHLNSYVLSPVVGWCLRLIDVQMDSVRYTYVFGHSIYEPVFFPTVFFFSHFPLHFTFDSDLAWSAVISIISKLKKWKSMWESHTVDLFFCNLCNFPFLWCWLRISRR